VLLADWLTGMSDLTPVFQVRCPTKIHTFVHHVNKVVCNVTNYTVNFSTGMVSFQSYRSVTVILLTPLSCPQPGHHS